MNVRCLNAFRAAPILVLIAALSIWIIPGAAEASAHGKHRKHSQAYSKKEKHVRSVPLNSLEDGGRGGATDPGDDYPAALKNTAQDSRLDPWREYNRECTSFVAWALHSRNGFEMPFYANARDWGAGAGARGYAVNHTPAAGSVAWSNAGAYGHVAFVQEVRGANVYIEEYNHWGNGTYSSRVVPATNFTGYIHFKDFVADAPSNTTQSTPPSPGGSSTTTPVAPATHAETTGGVANTWSNYNNAGGVHGPSIGSNQTVQIACKVTGFKVADGNTWWYRIASSPWNNAFYVSADAFYNNGQTSGSLIGTPFVDPAVANC